MALVLKDRVKETTTTTGTGSFSLAGAVTGYDSFGQIGTGNTTYYAVYLDGGSEWEVGIGTYTAPSTLSRDTILASSNSGSIVTFSAGQKTIWCDYPAGTSVYASNNGSQIAGQALKSNGLGVAPSWQNITNGTVTSVGITTSAASLAVTNSPITTSGNIGLNFAGVASQYVRGDGALANFPTSTGGGSSVSYYLNGSVNQGTFVGNTYYQMSKTPITATTADFSISANGYIAQFITDANDPALLNIPAGNWNFEMYFSASSSGGNPSFYVELYKYNGTAFTLISSGSTSPESITNGTVKDLYLTALPVPATTLTLTDRLAVRVYVNHDGRTITLHTQDANLCQVITTFSTGITALNGLTAQVQYLSVGTSGTDFSISSVSDTHTFNLPTASASNRGALSSSDWSTFNNKVTSVSGTTGRITSSGGTTPAIDLASGIVTAGTTGSSTAIPVITVDTYGRVTNVTTASNPQGTVTSVAALTLGTTGTDLSSTVANGTTTPVITLNVPTASATNRGALSSTDWTTFNNKANAFTYTTNYIPYGQGTTTPTQSANLTFNGTTLRATDITDASLTSGRVTYAGTGGNLVDSSSFTFDGTTVTAPIQRASNGIVTNNKTIATSYTIPSTDNAMSAGPVTINSGITITVSSGSRWVVL